MASGSESASTGRGSLTCARPANSQRGSARWAAVRLGARGSAFRPGKPGDWPGRPRRFSCSCPPPGLGLPSRVVLADLVSQLLSRLSLDHLVYCPLPAGAPCSAVSHVHVVPV